MKTVIPMRRATSLPGIALAGLAVLLAAVVMPRTAAAQAAQWQPLLSLDSIDFPTVDALYRDTIARDGNIGTLTAELKAYADDTGNPGRRRANALLVGSHVYWRFGQRTTAAEWVDRALKIETSADLALQQARLLEASGEVQQAQRWYEQAYELYDDPKRKEQVRLRMTFVAVSQQNIEALVRLAQQRDRDFRNRAAVALAVLSNYDEATGLYTVHGQGSERFRQHLRLAQWALEAGHAPGAQEEAWKAVQIAPLDRDRRYALSVLVDAHELDDSLDALLERFNGKGRLTEEEQDTRVDLLQKLGRHEEAIRLFQEGDRSQITAASRRQLLRMYAEAGRDADMAAEYGKLIAAEPAEVVWPEGLSQHLLEQGDRAGAEQAWRAFIGRNDAVTVLLTGARAMAQFGFDDLAVSATDKLLSGDTDAAAAALLFRFELHLRRGRAEEAEATLGEMNDLLAADTLDRVELADAYERIQKPMEALGVLEDLHRNRPNGLGADERMKMAWLYDSTGQREQALAVWQDMWNGQTTEAFRRLVENRLVTLAAETGTLGDLAVELETRLASGTANKKDSALLIRIYTDTGDSASAVEVIREYFKLTNRDGETDLESLREQANVYRAMGQYGAFKRITTRLVDEDPENRVDHLQSLVLNQLENAAVAGDDKHEQLQKWLHELRQTGGGAASAEFEAGILVLAGMEDQAITTYRQALADNPENSDNFLLLADLLKKRSREAEAIGALQYLVETAAQDDDFIVGVDGILNMRTGDKWIIEWAQRRVLERLTTRDDKLYLYDLLAELAEEAGNTLVYYSALENSLAYANSRRSNVLRELITATAGSNAMSAMMSGGRTREADPQRNLRYSRRLISLGEELPPEVYTDMGKTFLKMGDPENAEHAFNLAVDRTGEASLVEETGDLFRNEGYARQAAAQYEKALIADSDNVGIMRKLADVRARQGATSEANEMYLRGLLGVLQTLPPEVEKTARSTPPSLDSTVSYTYRQNYAALLTGFLYTLSPQEADAKFGRIEQAVDEALQAALRNAGGQIGKELAYYPRLNTLSRFARDAAQRFGRQALVDSLDNRLRRQFAHDGALVAELQSAPQAPEDVLRSLSSSREAADQALARKEYGRAIGIAAYNGDRDFMLSAYRDWAREVLQGPQSGAAARPAAGMVVAVNVAVNVAAIRPGTSGTIHAVMRNARQNLDDSGYRNLTRYVFDLVGGREELLRKMLFAGMRMPFGADAGTSELLDMEKVAGRPLASAGALRELVMAADARVLGSLDMTYTMARLAAADRVALFEKILGNGSGSRGVYGALPPLRALLTQPLNTALHRRVLDTVSKAFQEAAKEGGFAAGNVGMQLRNARLTDGMATQNLRLIEELDAFLAATFPDAVPAGTLKVDALMAAGREREALPLLVDVALSGNAGAGPQIRRAMAMMGRSGASDEAMAMSMVSQHVGQYASALYPRYKGELVALAQARLQQDKELKPLVFALLYALEEHDPQNGPRQQLQWLEEMAQRHADNEAVLSKLEQAYAQCGYTDQRIQILEKLVAKAPRNLDYRRSLFGLWQRLDNPEAAVKAADRRLGEVTVDTSRQAMMASMFGGRGADSSAVSRALEQMRAVDEGAVDEGGDVEQARNALRTVLQMLPPPGASWMDMRLLMSGEGTGVLQYQQFYALDWAPAGMGQQDARQRRRGARSDGEPRPSLLGQVEREVVTHDRFSREGKFLEKIIGYEYALAELEAHMRTLRLEDLEQNALFYSALADAWLRHGRLESQLAGVKQRVEAGEAGGKDAVLLLEMIARLPPEQAQALLPAAERAIAILGAGQGYRQLLVARVYARVGDDMRAADIFSAAMLAAMEGGSDPMQYMMGRTAHRSAADLYVEAHRHLGAAGLERFTGALLDIVRPDEELAGSGDYEQFVMWILERNPASIAAEARLQQLLGARSGPAMDRSGPLVEAVALLARLGQHDKALELLALSLQPAPASTGMAMDPFGNERQRAVAEYRARLGLSDVERMWMPDRQQPLLTRYARAFPAQAGAWAGVVEWTQRAAAAIPQWMAAGSVDRDNGLQLLGLLTLRQQQLGADEAALESARTLAGLLAPYDRAGEQTASFTVAVLEQVQAPLDVDMLRALIEHRRLDAQLLAPVLQRVSAQSGAEQALALGERALTYSQHEGLMQQVRALALGLGRTALVQQIDEQMRKATDARVAIERGQDATDVQLTDVPLDEGGAEAGPGPAIGGTMDLKFTDIDGREVDLAQMKGKVVLVDFWATWCGPCIAELPNVKLAYQTWHEQGFEIIGISLDRSNAEQKLRDFVADNDMPWPQHFDGLWWKNEFAVKNGVNAIPAAWLFDQDGKLVTKSARGKKLEEELQRLLSEQKNADTAEPAQAGGGT